MLSLRLENLHLGTGGVRGGDERPLRVSLFHSSHQDAVKKKSLGPRLLYLRNLKRSFGVNFSDL